MSKIQTNHSHNHSGILWRLLIYYSKTTKEFLRSTILNGLKYLTFKYLTICEKLFFLGCFIAVFYNSFYFATTIVEKWQTSPVLTVINPELTYISKEPFPAVTICNMNQAQHSKVKDFDVKSLDYAMLQKLCLQDLNYTSYAHLQTPCREDCMVDFIVKNAQSCSDMVVMCNYGGISRTCSDLFRETLLDEGLCCTFNAVHPFLIHKELFSMVRDYTTIDGPTIAINWNPEKGYPQELSRSFYPRVPFGDGINKGLRIILNGDLDNYYCSSTNGPGFKISLHTPIDTPSIKETGLSLHIGMETSFRVSSSKEEALDSLETSTKPNDRQCYFCNEYPLLYYRYYTRSNCERECDAKFLLRKCNCLIYHMPSVSNNVTKCDVRHFDCVAEVEHDFIDEKSVKCRKECLPSCNELSYSGKPFYIPLRKDGFAIINTFLRNLTKKSLKNYAVVNIYFPENYYRGMLKNPAMSFTEFLSQFGGILSLMMGFSIISVVEIAYFFVIKPIINCWRNVTKNMIDVTMFKQSQENQNQNLRYNFAKSQLPPFTQNIEQLNYVH